MFAVPRLLAPALGETALIFTLVAYPALGLVAGAVCALVLPRAAPWRPVGVLVLANPATYALPLFVASGASGLGITEWVATAVAGAVAYAVAARRRRERPANLCVDCGYNLTGNVSGRCPECGRAIGGGDSGIDPGAHQESTLSLRALAHATALIQALIVGVVACWTALLGQTAICRIGSSDLAGECLMLGLVAFPVVAFFTGIVCQRLLARIRAVVLIVCANPATFAVPYYVHDYGDIWSLMFFVWLFSAAMGAAGYRVGARLRV